MGENTNGTACMSSLSSISDHCGFHGSIKQSTSDFVVIEMNMNGQLVNVDNLNEVLCHQISEHTEPYHQKPNKKPKISAVVVKDTDYSCGKVVLDNHNTDLDTFQTAVLCEEAQDLDFILENSVNEALAQFAMSIRKCSHSELREKPNPTPLSLGMYPDKDQRASVHRAVRQKYPFLMTITNQCEILVKEDSHYKELSQLVSDEESEDFFRFLDAKAPNSTFTFQHDDNKEHRKAVHHFLSKHFGKLVETKSFVVDNSGGGQQNAAITVRFREKKQRSKKRDAIDAQDEDVLYTAFTLQKENLETLEAISYLASALGVLPSDFSYAGIKDKRAVTYQTMVVKKVSPERLKEVAPAFQKKAMNLYNMRPADQPIRLGQLRGNHFDIRVRNVKKHSADSSADLKDLVHEALENVKTKGFVNYYGPQRFGVGQKVQADQIGLSLLKEEMVTAVKLFFTPEVDDPLDRAKRHFLQTEDAKETLAMMPEYKVRERMVLRALNRFGMGQEGCTRGWLSIPHSMRVFYIHAYCSRKWNEAASYRLQTYGQRVVKGDLVFSKDANEKNSTLSSQVHMVTANEEEESIYTLNQVVLPMPGNSITYPDNKVGYWFKETLAKDGLQACKFRVHPLKLNIPGCYRLMLAYPKNLTYKLQHDSEVVMSEETPEKITNEQSENPTASASCLSLSFNLNSSCYATVCLREIMKCDP
ncbi:pseudouridylate synthase PUS7L [Acipenser ruthenus]|uniref:pseudouridylate synthase PUS7L n=1 Tax=Acipenser ruthenus TaxID=7906 RepID=UPI0027425D81|nr:pseudouridylate synthase PUS7L [Acipenser ruthenus]